MSIRTGFGRPYELAPNKTPNPRRVAPPTIGITSPSAKNVETFASAKPVETRAAPLETRPEITVLLTKDILYSKLDGLFRASGLGARGAEKWEKVLNNSVEALSLWDGNRLIAFARMSEADGGTTCTIHDAVILPGYRGQSLLTEMQSVAQDYIDTTGYSTALIEAVPGTEEMYEHLGWRPLTVGSIALQGSDGVVDTSQI